MLNRMIGKPVDIGLIEMLQVEKEKVELSHLQFTDDSIIFCPQSEVTIRNYGGFYNVLN